MAGIGIWHLNRSDAPDRSDALDRIDGLLGVTDRHLTISVTDLTNLTKLMRPRLSELTEPGKDFRDLESERSYTTPVP